MRPVFVVEPFGDARLLAAFRGAAPLPALEAAVLPGHGIRADAGGTRLTPFRQPGTEARGFILDAPDGIRARLEFWMTAIGARPRVAKVMRAGGEAAVVDTHLLPPDAAPVVWSAAAWAGEWRDMVAEAIEEALRHFGRIEPDRMAELMPGIGYRALARARGAAEIAPVRLRSELTVARDVEPLRLEVPYAAYFGVEEHLLRHRRFDGAMSPPLRRAVFTSGDAVTVLPFDPRAGTVLLIEQFRAGPLARRDPRPWCLETVAGRCDALETPEATARREAREEAGLELGRVERVAGYYPSPGIMAEYITAFVGEADLRAAGGRHGLDAEDEDIRAMSLPVAEALAAVTSGEMNNAPLLISLLWLEQHRARLEAAWR